MAGIINHSHSALRLYRAKDAAFVVRCSAFGGDKNVFNGGNKGLKSDNERKCARMTSVSIVKETAVARNGCL